MLLLWSKSNAAIPCYSDNMFTIRADGDANDAFGRAYEEFSQAIFRHCRLRLWSRERAQEIMQETFMKTWEYLARGKDIENVQAFLYRTANNLIVDEVRRGKPPPQSLETLEEEGRAPSREHVVHDVAQKLEGERAAAILAKLPPEQRDVLVLRYIDEFEPQEIAELLGVRPNVISVRIHRALKELRSLLPDA